MAKSGVTCVADASGCDGGDTVDRAVDKNRGASLDIFGSKDAQRADVRG